MYEGKSLKSLGARLRDDRLKKNESQAMFAARIGISVPTLRKMETGDPSVMIGYWATALDILGRISELESILSAPEDLFAKFDRMNSPVRRRASRKRT